MIEGMILLANEYLRLLHDADSLRLGVGVAGFGERLATSTLTVHGLCEIPYATRAFHLWADYTSREAAQALLVRGKCSCFQAQAQHCMLQASSHPVSNGSTIRAGTNELHDLERTELNSIATPAKYRDSVLSTPCRPRFRGWKRICCQKCKC